MGKQTRKQNFLPSAPLPHTLTPPKPPIYHIGESLAETLFSAQCPAPPHKKKAPVSFAFTCMGRLADSWLRLLLLAGRAPPPRRP